MRQLLNEIALNKLTYLITLALVERPQPRLLRLLQQNAMLCHFSNYKYNLFSI